MKPAFGAVAAAITAIVLAGGLLGACASDAVEAGGARPPQGPGPGGTQFGFWNRDAEGSVDASFRSYVSKAYDVGDEAKARAALETDGFRCQDGNRPDGAPVPQLDCTRLFKLNEDVHAWTVQFWANEHEPKARYTRTHVRDRNRKYDDSKS